MKKGLFLTPTSDKTFENLVMISRKHGGDLGKKSSCSSLRTLIHQKLCTFHKAQLSDLVRGKSK